MRNDEFVTPSRTSPKGGRRGCLCPDNKTYSKKCCDGSLQAQGIGTLTGGANNTINSVITTRTKTTSHG